MIYLEGIRSCDVFNGIFLIRTSRRHPPDCGMREDIFLIMEKRHPPDDGKKKSSS